jgi:putative spermidine/putrescine transport system permease protein
MRGVTRLKAAKNRFVLLSLVPVVLFIGAFLIVPLFAMIAGSFTKIGGGSWTIGNYIEIMTNAYYYQGIKNSVVISFLASSIAIIISVIAAYSITKLKADTQKRVLMLANMTANFAGVPLAFAYIILLGNSGLFTILFHELGLDIFQQFNLYSWSGLVILYIYFQIPLGTMLLYPIYHGIADEWKQAAQLLGASAWQFWLKIGLPFILPGIAGTFSILFANAMGAYATAYALVGSSFNLVPIRIGALVSGDIFAQPELGSALAVLLGLTMTAALLVNEWLMKKVRRDLR